MSDRYIFVGPSIPPETVRCVAGNWHVLPPISAGDLLRLRARKGDVVLIIDGYFRQLPAVRHKEILAALENGVHVWGASSIGALRACELRRFGMKGLGEVYELFATGQLDGDDEVAILHQGPEENFTPLTDALVNMRYNFKRAVADLVITQKHEQTLLKIAKGLPFSRRTYERVYRFSLSAGIPDRVILELKDYIRKSGMDLKRQDALAALSLIQNGLNLSGGNKRQLPRVVNNRYFYVLSQVSQGDFVNSEIFVPDHQVLNSCRVLAVDYPSIHYQVALRTIAACYGRKLGVETKSEESLLRDFREAYFLVSDKRFSEWLDLHRLTTDDLAIRLRDIALATSATTVVAERNTSLQDHQLGYERVAAEYLVEEKLLPACDRYPDGLSHWLSPQETTG